MLTLLCIDGCIVYTYNIKDPESCSCCRPFLVFKNKNGGLPSMPLFPQLNNGYGSSNFRFSDTTHMKVSINGEFPNHPYLMFFFHKPFQFRVPTRPQRPPIWSPYHLSFPTTISGATDPVPATAMPKGSAFRRTRLGGTRPTRPARRAPRARITPCVEPVSEMNVCT